MDFEKLLERFEKFVYNILVLIILIPKTLFRLVTHPKFSYDYVKDQFDLDEEERFKDFVSPILFIITAFIVPLYFLYKFYGRNHANEAANGINSLSAQDAILVYCLVVTFQPIISAALILLYKKEEITYDTLKRPFYTLLYIFSYLGVCMYPAALSDCVNKLSLNVVNALHLIAVIFLFIGAFLTLKALIYFYEEEFYVSKAKAVLMIFLTYLALSVIGSVIFFLLWLLGYVQT